MELGHPWVSVLGNQSPWIVIEVYYILGIWRGSHWARTEVLVDLCSFQGPQGKSVPALLQCSLAVYASCPQPPSPQLATLGWSFSCCCLFGSSTLKDLCHCPGPIQINSDHWARFRPVIDIALFIFHRPFLCHVTNSHKFQGLGSS